VNLTNFKQLPIFQQVEVLFNEGNPVLSRIYLFYNIQLYSYSGFYSEIWYRQTDNRIDRVITLDADLVLELYEKQISLNDLEK
jgi:hypothetical protein